MLAASKLERFRPKRDRIASMIQDSLGLRKFPPNEDLMRALRISWAEASLEIFDAIRPTLEAPWPSHALHGPTYVGELIKEFTSVAKNVRTEAQEVEVKLKDSPIDRHIKSVLQGSAELSGFTPTEPNTEVSLSFSGVLAELTNRLPHEIPILFQDAANGRILIAGNQQSQSFGDLVFSKFAQLIKSTSRHETTVSYLFSIGQSTTTLGTTVLDAIRTIEQNQEDLLSELSALKIIQDGATNLLRQEELRAEISGIANSSTEIKSGVDRLESNVDHVKLALENLVALVKADPSFSTIPVPNREHLYQQLIRLGDPSSKEVALRALLKFEHLTDSSIGPIEQCLADSNSTRECRRIALKLLVANFPKSPVTAEAVVAHVDDRIALDNIHLGGAGALAALILRIEINADREMNAEILALSRLAIERQAAVPHLVAMLKRRTADRLVAARGLLHIADRTDVQCAIHDALNTKLLEVILESAGQPQEQALRTLIASLGNPCMEMLSSMLTRYLDGLGISSDRCMLIWRVAPDRVREVLVRALKTTDPERRLRAAEVLIGTDCDKLLVMQTLLKLSAKHRRLFHERPEAMIEYQMDRLELAYKSTGNLDLISPATYDYSDSGLEINFRLMIRAAQGIDIREAGRISKIVETHDSYVQIAYKNREAMATRTEMLNGGDTLITRWRLSAIDIYSILAPKGAIIDFLIRGKDANIVRRAILDEVLSWHQTV